MKDSAGQKLAYVYFEEEPGGFNDGDEPNTLVGVGVTGALILRYLSRAGSGGDLNQNSFENAEPKRIG